MRDIINIIGIFKRKKVKSLKIEEQIQNYWKEKWFLCIAFFMFISYEVDIVCLFSFVIGNNNF